MKFEKGKKGFQPYDKEVVKSKRLSGYFTESESKKLIKFAKENNLSLSELFRLRVKDIID